MAIVGIDLGTTNSLVSVWRDGRVEMLKNSMGNLMTPSVVSVDEDGTILVGEVAKERRVSHPGSTAAEFKRSMGTDAEYILGDKKYMSDELSAFLLKKIIVDAENQLGEKITEAVISVPAYFDDNQREATKRAARFAGIKVRRLVNEPSAAILYKQWKGNNTGTDGIYVVVDFGGGTLDVSVVDCFENIIEIIAVSGNNKLGGKDFDRLIALDFCKKNQLDFGVLSRTAKENVLWAAENVKKRLTTHDTAKLHVIIGDKEYETIYDTEELLNISTEILVQIRDVLNEALRAAKVNPANIVDIVLVGGSCKMPVVQRYLSALFRRDVMADEDSELFVGYGTGLLTGIIGRENEISDIVMTDVCPFSLGTGTHSSNSSAYYMSVIIPKNSILPISKSKIYCGLEPFQQKIRFEIFQGEELYARNNLSLGELTVNVTPDSNGKTLTEITFCYDINGILEVTARDLNGDNTAETVVVNKNSQLTPEEIESKKIDMDMEMRFEKNKEDNRNILAWGERLYAQADSELKSMVAAVVSDFAESVWKNDIVMVQRKKRFACEQLLKLELIINRDYFGDDDGDD